MEDLHLDVAASNSRLQFPELARIREAHGQDVEERGKGHQAEEGVVVVEGGDAIGQQHPMDTC